MDIRDARPEELEAVAMALVSAYREFAASLPKERWERYAENIADVRGRLDRSELIVAVEGPRILGSVTFFPGGSGAQEQGWPTGWAGIRLLGVLPEARGRGVGRALMQECLRRARERGLATVGLHTTELMSVAQQMYERMGFVRATELDFNVGSGRFVLAYRLDL